LNVGVFTSANIGNFIDFAKKIEIVIFLQNQTPNGHQDLRKHVLLSL